MRNYGASLSKFYSECTARNSRTNSRWKIIRIQSRADSTFPNVSTSQNPQQLLRLGGTWDRAGSLYGVFNDTPNHPLLLRPGPAITAAVWNPSREGEPQYLNRAFSAPRICTVEAGYLARFVRLPAWEMRRAPTYKKKIKVRERLVHLPKETKQALFWPDFWNDVTLVRS